MTTGNLYYRKKKGHIIIEQKVDGKTKYIKTLPKPEVLLSKLWPEASDSAEEKLPEKEPENEASQIEAGESSN